MTKRILSNRKSALLIDEDVKNESADALNKYLVNFTNLFLITKQAHWNLQGKNFISIHEMLDAFYESLQKHSDVFAERLVQLGFVAIATPEQLVKNNIFEEYPSNISSETEHLSALHFRYSSIANQLRKTVEDASVDAVTLDYLAQALAELDKFIWFIEAHLN